MHTKREAKISVYLDQDTKDLLEELARKRLRSASSLLLDIAHRELVQALETGEIKKSPILDF